MHRSRIMTLVVALSSLGLQACVRSDAHEKNEGHGEEHAIVLTSPAAKDVVVTQPYVCQIHSRRHIEVRALEEGYLEAIGVKEGQMVNQDEILFRVVPSLYKAKYDAEVAEADFARVEYANTKLLNEKNFVSDQEVKLYQAKLARAEAKAKLASAELGFTEVKAQFTGIIDRLYQQQGSLVGKGDLLTTLSDNDVMWVYFNVPEALYLDYEAHSPKHRDEPQKLKLADTRIDLVLANGRKFEHGGGDTVTIEGKFNNETGNIAFRADIANPDHLLRHGQTGTVLIHRMVKNAVVIPQRATFEILDKQYVWVVGEDHVVHQKPIVVDRELDDIYVLKSGVGLKDKIILSGVQQVHDGQKLDGKELEFETPEKALAHQKFHAE